MVDFDSSFGSFDAGKIMEWWGKVTKPSNQSSHHPLGYLYWDDSRVYDNDSFSDDHCVVDFNEPGELCEYEDAKYNAKFFALCYELVPRLVAVIANDLTGAANKVQIRAMIEQVEGITGLFDMFAAHNADCSSAKKSTDQWENSGICTCGLDTAKEKLQEMTNGFLASMRVVLNELDHKEIMS